MVYYSIYPFVYPIPYPEGYTGIGYRTSNPRQYRTTISAKAHRGGDIEDKENEKCEQAEARAGSQVGMREPKRRDRTFFGN